MKNKLLSDKAIIKPYKKVEIKIYAYNLPNVPDHNGYIKVGETEREVKERIKEQTSTAGLKPKILFSKKALKSDGKWFHDKDLHRFFMQNGIKKEDFGTGASEWFYFNGTPERCEELTNKFIANDYDEIQVSEDKSDYKLRKEQADAVRQTLEYIDNPTCGEKEFLWNAKPRFGKTLTTYDLVRQIKHRNKNKNMNVLIVTNRPAIANSWFDDFEKFIRWQEKDFYFVSETDALKNKAVSRQKFSSLRGRNSCIAFYSLQDLKGARRFGGDYDKLEWIADLKWDLLVIDEAHEGVDTVKTDNAFNEIKRDFTLHLSGTPFKALASNKFSEQQIYNWSYVDEQKSKAEWNGENANPYRNLPELSLFTYQMSQIIEERVKKGVDIDGRNVDYAFDLNEFFLTNKKGDFVHESDVCRFLDNMTENSYPFAETEYRNMLNHTFWLLPGVAACKAMEKLLKEHSFFSKFKVVLAAGDGKSIAIEENNQSNITEYALDEPSNKKSFDKVREAIKENEFTITLSCGQLTTGVTIPEWTAVFMLSNIKSASLYFQAAFRAQNPYEYEKNGHLYRKEAAYIFDFAPERTLSLYDEFANNLCANLATETTIDRATNIKELLNYFAVIAHDEKGKMRELDFKEVLEMPNKIKAREVVQSGFMNNFLFKNLTAIFNAPQAIREIFNNMPREQHKRKKVSRAFDVPTVSLDEKGNVSIPDEVVINETKANFGEKIYGSIPDEIENTDFIDQFRKLDFNPNKLAKEIAKETLKNNDKTINDFAMEHKLNKKDTDKTKKEVKKDIENGYAERIKHLNKMYNYDKEKLEKEIQNATNEEEKSKYQSESIKLDEEFNSRVKEELTDTQRNALESIVKTQYESEEEKKKHSTEIEMRERLRGFARAIPACLMAYCNRDTTIDDFDTFVDSETFYELTNVTLDDFRLLRDGGEYIDENGVKHTFNGFFDEIVFNNSIKEFFDLKEKLSDYLKDTSNEDIFDYIPPQKTNQIFTPKRVVNKMVNMLEEENPAIFENRHIKFLDPYVKSGLYMTEIIKRLNKGLKKQIPNDTKRIKWIMENQVYGCAPSNIIYNIVKRYVYDGFAYVRDKNLFELNLENKNIEKEIEKKAGEKVKFDVIIGNPPYQENIREDTGNSSLAKQLFPSFVMNSIGLNSRYVSFIIPSRWFTGNAQDKSFLRLRDFVRNHNHISHMYHYDNAKEVFPDVEIKGGVCYFLYDKNHNGNVIFSNCNNNKENITERKLFIDGVDIILTENMYPLILDKVITDNFTPLTTITKGRNAFGIVGKDDIVANISSPIYFDGACELRCKDNTIRYIQPDLVSKNKELFQNKYKIFISKSAGAPHNDKKVIGKPYIGYPDSACTDSLIPIGNFDTCEEAKNLGKYLQTKFLRMLVQICKSSQNVYQIVYRFVPMQNFTNASDINWTQSISNIDKQLYKKYGLNSEEIEFIDNKIQAME